MLTRAAHLGDGGQWPPPLTTFVVRSEVPLLHVVPGKVRIAVYA